MVFPGEHRAQVYLVSIQSLVVIAGCMVVTATIKMLDEGILASSQWGKVLLAVRSAGILLLLLPALWAILTVRLERSETGWWSRAWTLASGVALAVGLAWFFVECVVMSFSPMTPIC
jgi:hypothetical protein